jgi:hypothetical protein
VTAPTTVVYYNIAGSFVKENSSALFSGALSGQALSSDFRSQILDLRFKNRIKKLTIYVRGEITILLCARLASHIPHLKSTIYILPSVV